MFPVERSSSTESLLDEHLNDKSFFHELDRNGSGFIEQDDLLHFCYELSPEEFQYLYNELDNDGDGLISADDFKLSFCAIQRVMSKMRRVSTNERDVQDNLVEPGYLKKTSSNAKLNVDVNLLSTDSNTRNSDEECQLKDDLSNLSCQEQVFDLYQTLSTEYPQLVQPFESIIMEVIKDFKCHRHEHERLESTFLKEKEAHEAHLRRLETELEAQVIKIEEKIRNQERTRYAQLINKKMAEVEMFQESVRRAQDAHATGLRREEEETIKSQVEAIREENRLIKAELVAAETNLALSKTELIQLSQEHNEKCKELVNEKCVLLNYIKEQERLNHQLQMLHTANRKLHDTNDDLRSALENRHQHQVYSVAATTLANLTSPSSGYGSPLSRPGSGFFEGHEILSLCDPVLNRRDHLLPVHDTCEIDSLPEEPDSGHSTLLDITEIESDICLEHTSSYNSSSFKRRERNSKPNLRRRRIDDADDTEAHESDFDCDRVELRRPCTLSLPGSKNNSNSCSPTRKSNFRPSGTRSARHSLTPRSSGSSSAPTIEEKIVPNGPPERMFKVVLAGDAAVGKSSFITRLCDGRFVGNIVSTLGVDFKTKTIDVDGHVFALQLWDTAGQERFRSVAKSYFRRADGVLLLYDCTYERSFLNVREWIDAIEDSGCGKSLPIMIVANKCDLRKEFEESGRRVITSQEGKRLAQEYNALFIECSTLEGDNMLESVTELSRLLRTQEDLEVCNVNVHLSSEKRERKSEMFNCCN